MYFNHAARRNNFCLKENKNYKNMLHIPHMNDDYCSQCEEKKQNRNQENYMMLSFWQEKKLKTKPRKKHFYS